jgi:2-polyprenyl-6-methoxyphenol hydroxylase-like FAD-dependent oxidoreductase
MHEVGRSAVVLGAGMAGLLAARVLAEGYARVTLVDRDRLEATTQPRKGVPQGRHTHLLVPRGTQVLGELFPGLVDELVTGGMPVIRDLSEMHFSPGGHLLRLVGRPDQPFICQAARPWLEAAVRERVRALPGVDIVERAEIVGLVTTADRDRVTGVRVHRPDTRSADGAGAVIDADLVVDATGRGSRAPAWLQSMGFDRPVEDRLDVRLAYASRHLRLHAEALRGRRMISIGAQPDHPVGFVLVEQGPERWILTALGYDQHHPPTDPEGFLAFVEAIAPPDVSAAIRDADPLGDIVAHRFPASVRRRYERLRRFPDGLLVFGDAICSTNPAYALGMSVAALQAEALRVSLAGGRDDLAGRFFRSAAKPVDVAWQLTTGSDLALPQVRGARPWPVRAVNAYVERVLRAAEHDPVVAEQFLRVVALQAAPRSVFLPSTVVRVLHAHLRQGRLAPREATTVPGT